MIEELRFELKEYSFSDSLPSLIEQDYYVKDHWPVVYILSDGKVKEAYIGETADAASRLTTHLRNSKKNHLTAVHLVTSKKFNKSATLDIESNLIRYFSGDGKYKLLNGNLGLSNHNYFQKKEVYWDLFQSLWSSLKEKGIVRNGLDVIDNSDLFKYSPYKALTAEQRLNMVDLVRILADDQYCAAVIEGGAGTGKSIMAVYLVKALLSDLNDFDFSEFGEEEIELLENLEILQKQFPKPKVAIVVPMASFRKTLQTVFRNVHGLNAKMVIGPAEVSRNTYDILLVDESHRLRQRKNLGPYFKPFDLANERLDLPKDEGNELDWVLMQAEKTILFYDRDQSIKPSDVDYTDFYELKEAPSTFVGELRSQFRVKGGTNYVDFIDRLLKGKLDQSEKWQADHYEFKLFESAKEMVDAIKENDQSQGLSRLVSGYSWPWISKKDKEAFDITVDGILLRWNTTNIDWVNSSNAVNEVGCIHTTQGYDLNYAGIILGEEITYNPETKQIEIIKENYHDKAGRTGIKDPEVLKDYILNIYKTILLRSIHGTYLYACDEHLRNYLKEHLPFIERKRSGTKRLRLYAAVEVSPFEDSLPVVDIKAAAGGWSDLQKHEEFQWMKVDGIVPREGQFVCQVVGESMNKIIPNGSWCVFEKYTGGSRDGKIVLVQHQDIQESDFGAGYTVKRYRSEKQVTGELWTHQSIRLEPMSEHETYADIQLNEDELESLVVIGVFKGLV
jgi:DUF2075 family protein/predicted GIY-YIG superfamily endonuclease